MENLQYITRTTNIDSAHRVMNEFMKCFHLHGHTYITEMTFSFSNMEEIGYAIDFKEIKRVYVEFLQEYFDHGAILNPKDGIVINTVNELGTKLWLMSLNGEGEYCNPSVENIAKEMFILLDFLCEIQYGNDNTGLKIHKLKVYETPNCYTECFRDSIKDEEYKNVLSVNGNLVRKFAEMMGILNYDDRK